MARTALRPGVLLLVGLTLALGLLGALPWLRLGSDPVWGRIQAGGRWRVGMDPSFPPFEFLDASGQMVGLDVDLAQALGQAWGVETELVAIGFDSLVDAVEAHRVDAALSGLTFDPRRTRDVRHSIPYFDAGIRLAVAADSPIQALSEIADGCVAVEWGSGGDAVARRLLRQSETPPFQVQAFPSPEAALEALATGVCVGVLMDTVSLRLAQAEGAPIRLLDPPLESEPYVVVLPLEARTLQAEVDRLLERFGQDGTLARLEARWFGAFVDGLSGD